MARRRRRTNVRTRKLSPGQDLVVIEQPAPMQAAPKRRGRIRRAIRRSGVGGRSMSKHTIMGAAIGGLGYGVLEKAIGDKIPVIPLLGKPGTIALGIYMFGGTNKLLADIGIAAAAIAGYQLGTEGVIHGDYRHGLASEA